MAINRHLLRIAILWVKEYQQLVKDLESRIVASRIKRGILAQKLGLPYKTFYRKLKKRTFTNDEMESLIKELENSKPANEEDTKKDITDPRS